MILVRIVVRRNTDGFEVGRVTALPLQFPLVVRTLDTTLVPVIGNERTVEKREIPSRTRQDVVVGEGMDRNSSGRRWVMAEKRPLITHTLLWRTLHRGIHRVEDPVA
jgi:hypothetical protein